MSALISYAQNFEDVMLWRALSSVSGGFYIDIGAQDPLIDSVSRLFYEHGWRGVHVEPTSAYADALRKNRPDETVIQAVVSDEVGSVVFHEIAGAGLSTGDAAIAESHRRSGSWTVTNIVAPAMTLASVLEFAKGREIHWLKIDVEGYEARVLHSWGDHAARPWILVIESVSPGERKLVRAQWEHEVFERGYKFAYFDGLNSFYVHEDHEELLEAFAAPPNVFDGFVLSGLGTSTFHVDIKARVAANAEASRDVSRDALYQPNEELEWSRRQNAYLRQELADSRERLVAAERERAKSETLAAYVEEKAAHSLELYDERHAREIELLERRFEQQTLRSKELLMELERIAKRRARWLKPLRVLGIRSGSRSAAFSRPTPPESQNDCGAAGDAGPVDAVSELLNLDGEAFVRAAYQTILGRAADPAGLDAHCAALTRGLDKARIILALATSQEARLRGGAIAGLGDIQRGKFGGDPARPGDAAHGYQARFWLKRIAARSNASSENRF